MPTRGMPQIFIIIVSCQLGDVSPAVGRVGSVMGCHGNGDLKLTDTFAGAQRSRDGAPSVEVVVGWGKEGGRTD